MANTPHNFTVHGAGEGTRGWFTALVAYGGEWDLGDDTESPDRLEQQDNHGRYRRFSGKVQDTGHDSGHFGGILTDVQFSGDVGPVEINGKTYSKQNVVEDWQRDAGVSANENPSLDLDVGCPDDVGYSPQTRTSGQQTRHDIEFDRTVHAVDDLGWERDDGGKEVVNTLPEDDGTLIEVPDGEFVVGRNVLMNPQRWGIVGLGENAVLRAPNSKCVRMVQISGNDPGRDILLENLTFDQRGGNQAGIELSLHVHDNVRVENCQRVGRTPNRYTAGPPYEYEPNGISISIRDPDGSGTIVRWTDRCETDVVDYPLNAQGIFTGYHSKGRLTVRETSIMNQGEHALYGSKARKVGVERCYLWDNVNTNLRIAGGGSYAEDCSIGYTRDLEYTNKSDEDGRKATKLVRMEHSRDHGVSGGHLKRCELVCGTDGLTDPIMLHIMGNVGGVLGSDLLIRNDSDSRTVVVDAEGSGWRGFEIPGDDSVRLERVKFTGSTSSPPVENGREGAVSLDECEVDMPNAAALEGV